MQLSAQEINTLMSAISDAIQYAREHQDETEYKPKKEDYRKLYHKLSNQIELEVNKHQNLQE